MNYCSTEPYTHTLGVYPIAMFILIGIAAITASQLLYHGFNDGSVAQIGCGVFFIGLAVVCCQIVMMFGC